LNIPSNPCSYKKYPESICLSTITHKIYNPFMLPVPKIFVGLVVDAFVYHKYCKSRSCFGMSLEASPRRLVLKGKPLHQHKTQFEGFPSMSFCPKTSTSREITRAFVICSNKICSFKNKQIIK